MATGKNIRRERMIKELVTRGIKNETVLAAMRAIPREQFVDEALQAKAYGDTALPIGDSQTISQPWIVARMCELSEPDGKGKVLEIGSGSGYHAAVLGGLYELVYSVERIPEFSRRALQRLRALQIENVHFKIFDGSYGWGEFAPYNAIVVTAAVPEIPAPLLEQLEEGGRLIAPIAPSAAAEDQVLTRFVKGPRGITRQEHGPCRFVPLVGKYGISA